MVLSMTSTRNLLTWFLVTLLVLQGVEALSMMNGIDIALNGEDAVSINQELFDGVPTLTVAKGNKLGGRKMVVDIGMKKDQLMKDAVLNQETTKISGKDRTNESKKLLKGSQEKMDDQTDLDGEDNESIPSSENSILEMSDSDNAFQKSDARMLLEESVALVSLMHKDYKGFGKGKRKPPVHNYEPLKEGNVKP